MDRRISDAQLDRAIDSFLVERGDEVVAAARSIHRPAPRAKPRAGLARPLTVASLLALFAALLASAGVLVGSQLLWPAPTPSPLGGFTPAGTLDEPLEYGYFTATALPDGRVLIVGGCASCTTAQLWDSTTMTFSPAGSLPEGRDGHAATLLPDGRVLVLGGYVPPDKSETHPSVPAELWDPRTLSFSPAGAHGDFDLYAPPTAMVLPDGRVLMFEDTSTGKAGTFELWDPGDGTFHQAGTLPDGFGDIRVGLGDGRVLIVGGPFEDGSSRAEVWDPQTQSFSPAGSLAQGAGADGAATLLADGRVLISGGYAYDASTAHSIASAEVWDPATEAFSQAGTMSVSRDGHTATLLPDGRVLVVGGRSGHLGPDTGPDGEWQQLGSAEVWDPPTNTFSPTGSMSAARAWHTASLLPDGRVFIFGGLTGRWPTERTDTDGELWSPR